MQVVSLLLELQLGVWESVTASQLPLLSVFFMQMIHFAIY